MDKRPIVQLLTTLLYNLNLPGFLKGRIYQGNTKSVCVPGLNCYSCPGAIGACPLGSLQSAFSGVSIRFPFYILGLLLFFAIVLGRFICGWLCPFGFFQELLHKIPSPKLQKSHITRYLSYGKYIIGILFVILIPLGLYVVTDIGLPAFCEYICPAGTFEAAIPLFLTNKNLLANIGMITALKFSILFLIIIFSIVIFRPFCRFLCPLGAFYGLFNKLAIFGIAIDATQCTNCGTCARICQMDIKIAGDRDCISCGKCITACPEQAIHFKNLRTKTYPMEVDKK